MQKSQKLKELNIALSVDEVKKIQFSFLNRPATLTELVLFSIKDQSTVHIKAAKINKTLFNRWGSCNLGC